MGIFDPLGWSPGNSVFNVLRNGPAILWFISMAALFSISPSNVWGIQLHYIFANTCYLWQNIYSHPGGCEVVIHCSWGVDYAREQQCSVSLHMCFDECIVYLLWRYAYQIHFAIFNWLFFYYWVGRVLYIFWILEPYKVLDLWWSCVLRSPM